jgi:hypothetical protein
MWPSHLGSFNNKYSQALLIPHHHYLNFNLPGFGSVIKFVIIFTTVELMLAESVGSECGQLFKE